MMHRLSCAVITVRMVTLLAAAAGCGSSSDSASKAPDKVTYLTAYGYTGRDAFAWVAQDKGYFTQEHLDVTIKPGAAASFNVKLISTGQAQFAALDLTGAMIAVGNGSVKGEGFRAFAAIHQRNLSAIITLARSRITSPKDLEGKTLVTATGGVSQLLFPAYAKRAGIDARKVHWVTTAPPSVAAVLASGHAAGAATFLIGTGGIEKAAGGEKTNVLPYSDYLEDVYGSALITSPKLASSNPDLVRRFRDAMLKALAYTIEHPDEAAHYLHEAQPTAVVASAVGEIERMAPYTDSSSSGVPLGAIDRQRMSRAIALLESHGLIKPGVLTADQVVDFDLIPRAR